MVKIIFLLTFQVLGDGIWFYEEFFSSITSGMQSKLDNITVTETNLSTTSYVECLQYLLMQDQQSEIVIEYLINTQVNQLTFSFICL